MNPATIPDGTVTIAAGRRLPMDDTTSTSPLRDIEARGLRFATAEDLAAHIGAHLGYHSTLPTSVSNEWDSITWWIDDAFELLATDHCQLWFQLVPTLTEISTGQRARLRWHARCAAGLVTIPVEQMRRRT